MQGASTERGPGLLCEHSGTSLESAEQRQIVRNVMDIRKERIKKFNKVAPSSDTTENASKAKNNTKDSTLLAVSFR